MLSSNAPFSEEGFAAVIRDLERVWLQLDSSASGDLGGVVGQSWPQSAQDQTVQTGGDPPVTQAQLDAAIGAIPSVTYPISIANGGTGSISSPLARLALGVSFANSFSVSTAGSGTFTVPAGVTRICINIVGGGGRGDGSTGGYASVAGILYVDGVISGGGGGSLIAAFDVTPGESFAYTCGASGTIGSSAGNSSFSGTGVSLFAYGGNYGYRGASGGPGYGGIPIVSLLAASRNPIAFGFRGHAGTCSGYITGGGITVLSGGNNGGPATGIMSGGGYAASSAGDGSWSAAQDGQVLVLY